MSKYQIILVTEKQCTYKIIWCISVWLIRVLKEGQNGLGLKGRLVHSINTIKRPVRQHDKGLRPYLQPTEIQIVTGIFELEVSECFWILSSPNPESAKFLFCFSQISKNLLKVSTFSSSRSC